MSKGQLDLTQLVKSAVDFLSHLSSSRNMKSRYSYKKIAQELNRIEEPLYSLDGLKSIKGAGSKTIKRIQEFVDKKVVESIKTEDDLEKYSNILSPDAYDETKKKLSSRDMLGYSLGNDADEEKRIRIPRKRKYVPGYRTGSYGIMKALWIREGITKHEIAHIGRNYCDSEFDFTARHSAWSSMKTLTKKGIVYKEGRSKFYLTDEGRELATTMFANTSAIEEEEEEVTLIIDAREIKSRKFRLFFQEYFESKKIRHDTRILEVGDFLWIRGEKVCGFIIERKKGSDFVSSIMDGRFKEQKNRLKSTGIKKIFYIVEGLKSTHMQSVGKGLVMSCLATTKLEGFIVIETKDITQTGSVIHMIDCEVRKGYEKGLEAPDRLKKDEECEEYLKPCESSDGEMEMSYGSFIDKGAKGKGRTQTYLLYISLLSIKGMGHKKAWALAEFYKTIGELIGKVKNNGPGKLYEFEVEGKKISRKNADDIIEFFLK
ncbi:Ercc4-type nuclease [Encephalitozoon romaleae SJ-2008]|uniref:Crossover junction endonuclease MUS81 n=1 Tax=Encephalitozoon romaleae (strain SJ-2008) TaxID=1178016 RepID=I7ADD2_ENCRO|nr:Ercc4-type nuclease [Encephalitozoon romaleae SJ-2008]AFN82605.1 Ercc4-type nuclease [Encephalitozoon romaleae SJ-2008]